MHQETMGTWMVLMVGVHLIMNLEAKMMLVVVDLGKWWFSRGLARGGGGSPGYGGFPNDFPGGGPGGPPGGGGGGGFPGGSPDHGIGGAYNPRLASKIAHLGVIIVIVPGILMNIYAELWLYNGVFPTSARGAPAPYFGY